MRQKPFLIFPSLFTTAVVALVPWYSSGTRAIHPERQTAPRTISGAEHPELIPLVVTWESVFRTSWQVASRPDGTMSEENVHALATRNFHISIADTRKLLVVAKAVNQRVDELRAPFEREHQTGESLGWTPAMRKAREQEIREVITDARDSLVCQLSAGGFKRLKSWVERSIVPGIQVDVNVK